MMTDFGGRIDQLLSQVNTLFKQRLPNDVGVYLQSHDTLAWLLPPGQHAITIPEAFVAKEIWCGYIPMNGDAVVTTTGFKYDTSNTIFIPLIRLFIKLINLEFYSKSHGWFW